MYYELYIDVLFLENFMMDSLLLLAVKRMMRSPSAYGRVFLGAALGSGLTCLVISLPLPWLVKFLLFHTTVNIAMLKTGIRIKGGRALIKAIAFLYLFSVLLGGILEFLRPYVRNASLFYFVAVFCYYLLQKGWELIKRTARRQRDICDVTLYTQRGEYRVRALIDTGNTLEDKLLGEPVNIVDRHAAKTLLKDVPAEGLRYIPYRCIGKESVIPVIRIEKMCVHLKEEQWVTHPLLGIGEENISKQDEYQMILNPDILGGI